MGPANALAAPSDPPSVLLVLHALCHLTSGALHDGPNHRDHHGYNMNFRVQMSAVYSKLILFSMAKGTGERRSVDAPMLTIRIIVCQCQSLCLQSKSESQ